MYSAAAARNLVRDFDQMVAHAARTQGDGTATGTWNDASEIIHGFAQNRLYSAVHRAGGGTTMRVHEDGWSLVPKRPTAAHAELDAALGELRAADYGVDAGDVAARSAHLRDARERIVSATQALPRHNWTAIAATTGALTAGTAGALALSQR